MCTLRVFHLLRVYLPKDIFIMTSRLNDSLADFTILDWKSSFLSILNDSTSFTCFMGCR